MSCSLQPAPRRVQPISAPAARSVTGADGHLRRARSTDMWRCSVAVLASKHMRAVCNVPQTHVDKLRPTSRDFKGNTDFSGFQRFPPPPPLFFLIPVKKKKKLFSAAGCAQPPHRVT